MSRPYATAEACLRCVRTLESLALEKFQKKRMVRSKHVSLLSTVAENVGFGTAGQAVAEQMTTEGAMVAV